MNKTEQAKRDMAYKMLRGQIEPEEVAMISGVPLDEVKRMRADLDEQERKALGGVTIREMGGNDVLIDNEILDEDEPEDSISDKTEETSE